MNHLLRVLDTLLPRQTNWALVFLFAFGVLWLVITSMRHYIQAQDVYLMSVADEKEYALCLRYDHVFKDSAWRERREGESPTSRILRDDYAQHARRFIPVIDDFRRSIRELVSAEGGNLATMEELTELKERPEVHVMVNNGAHDMLKWTLENGNTASNHLVWRRVS